MEAGAFSSTETKAEGAILDLLKDVSQFNKIGAQTIVVLIVLGSLLFLYIVGMIFARHKDVQERRLVTDPKLFEMKQKRAMYDLTKKRSKCNRCCRVMLSEVAQGHSVIRNFVKSADDPFSRMQRLTVFMCTILTQIWCVSLAVAVAGGDVF